MTNQDLYTIGEVAAILGVSPHTIRAWERRHGIVKPLRTQTMQRRYRAEDVEFLREVKRAIDLRGMSLKLAFRSVSGAQNLSEDQPYKSRPKRLEIWPFATTGGVWRAVADLLPQMIMVVNLNGEIVEGNVAAAKAFGTTRQRLAGRSFPDLVDPFDRAKAVRLYRPQPLTVQGWELNVMTQRGARLYSFQSWAVSQGSERSLALVGSEMFERSEPGLLDLVETAGSGSPRDSDPLEEHVSASSFQKLVDELPYGLAVTTVGREPRVVYANLRFAQTLGRAAARFTGQRLSELIPNPIAVQTLHQVAATRLGKTLNELPDREGSGTESRLKYLHIAFRPLFSSDRRVSSVLVLLHDATTDVTWRVNLEGLIADQRIEGARTPEELAQLGVDYLMTLAPRVDFAIAVATAHDSRRFPFAIASTVASKATGSGLDTRSLARLVKDCALSGKRFDAETTRGRHSLHLTAVPLIARGARTSNQTLGAVAWRRPSSQPAQSDQSGRIEAFVARLAIVAELLSVRVDALRTASQLEAIVAAAADVPLSGGPTGLGARFLERLANTLRADRAAIGRVTGSRFVVEVAYSRQGDHAQPGDQLPVPRHVFDSVRSAEAVARSRAGVIAQRKPIGRAVAPMRHELSVPLVLDRKVMAVITLERRTEMPFDPQEVRFVQTLSSVGLLAVSLARRDGSP